MMALRLVIVSLFHSTAVGNFEGCIGGEGKDGMKFLVNDRVTKGFCSDQTPAVTDEVMDTLCQNFCQGGIPFLMGSSLAGFNLNDTNYLCDNPITADSAKVSQCRTWAEGLDAINGAASDFVASMRILTFEQLKYKAAVMDQVADLEKIVTSDTTAGKVKGTTKLEDRMKTFKGILQNNLNDMLSDGVIQSPVTKQMKEVQTKANRLMEELKKIDNLDNFVTQCNSLYLGNGPNDEYLLDICPHSGNQCLNTPNGRHVSCCCGVVPAAGMYGIQAKNSPSTPTRLLEKGPKPVLDVCGAAYQKSTVKVDEIKKDIIKYSEGQKILKDYLIIEGKEYPDYYSSCDRRLHELETSHASLESEIVNGTQVLRKLQDQNFLSCSRPEKPSRTIDGGELQAAFTEDTQKSICKKIPGYSNEKLAEMCNEFCEGTHSATIPFLLGSLEMGFSQQAMDELCLKPATTEYSRQFVDDCQKKGASFRQVQAATASFIGSLKRLELAKVYYIAQLQEKTKKFAEEMKENIKVISEEEVASTMAEPLKQKITDNVNSILLASAASDDVKTEIANVKAKGDGLKQKLTTVMPDLEVFLKDCNEVVTGVGSRGEYLMDFCSKQGKFCIEDPVAEHAGCCCGYNPISSLGMGSTISSKATIQGNTANPSWVPESAAESSGESISESITYNICGESSRETSSDVKSYETRIKAVPSGGSLLAENQEQIKIEYPSYNDRCKEINTASVDPPGTGTGPEPVGACYRSLPSIIAFSTMVITRWQW